MTHTPDVSRRRFVTAALGAAFASTWRVAAVAQDAPVAVTIALSSNALPYGGLFIAEKAGLFGKHGVAPKIVVMDSGNAATTALISGSAQFSSSGPGEVLAARARGQPVTIVANIYRGLSASLVLAKPVADKLNVAPTAPVRERLKALDGLAIAAPSATSAYLHPVKRAAEEVGAKPRFLYMSQPAMVAALQTGAIQAMLAGAPYSYTPVSRGYGVTWISGPKGELPPEVQPTSSACLQTTEQYAGANPAVIARMRAVLDELAQYIRSTPDEAKRNLAAAYPQLDPAAIDQAFALDAANWSRPVLTEADIQQEIRILASTGLVAGVTNVKPAEVLWKR